MWEADDRDLRRMHSSSSHHQRTPLLTPRRLLFPRLLYRCLLLQMVAVVIMVYLRFEAAWIAIWGRYASMCNWKDGSRERFPTLW